MSRALPILFNTEMVRAILDGRKTCTRRVIKLLENIDGIPVGKGGDSSNPLGFMYPGCIKRPQYQPGDILYVRETIWQKVGHYLDVDGETKGIFCHEYKYVATDEKPETGWNYSWVKHPSIHPHAKGSRPHLVKGYGCPGGAVAGDYRGRSKGRRSDR